MLTGSFAIGDVDEHCDVDFAVVTHRDLNDQKLHNLTDTKKVAH